MYILRPIIDLVADPAVCQRAVLTEGLQSTGEASSRRQPSWVSNHSPILFSRSFSQSSSVIRAAFSRYSSILSKTVASIVTISISVFNWFETNIAEQRSFLQTPVVRCHQISSDGRNKIKPQDTVHAERQRSRDAGIKIMQSRESRSPCLLMERNLFSQDIVGPMYFAIPPAFMEI